MSCHGAVKRSYKKSIKLMGIIQFMQGNDKNKKMDLFKALYKI